MEEVKLVAIRPDAARFDRLARIYAAAENAARTNGNIARWGGAMAEVYDAKGDLTVVWRTDEHRQLFAGHFDDAWRAEGESEPIVHSLMRPDPAPSENTVGAPKRRSALGVAIWALMIGTALGTAVTYYILGF